MGREFTLEEARASVPAVRRLLEGARADMQDLGVRLKKANEALLETEWALREERLRSGDSASPFASDRRWKTAARQLEELKTQIRDHLRGALADLHERGVLLRDLERGLVDFPGRSGNQEVFWCWHVGEETVSHWHSRNEGFANRKSVRNIATRG